MLVIQTDSAGCLSSHSTTDDSGTFNLRVSLLHVIGPPARIPDRNKVLFLGHLPRHLPSLSNGALFKSLGRRHQGAGEGRALRLYRTPVIPRGNDAFVFRQIDIGQVVGIGQGQLNDDGGE
jgi:hypothetical protein